MGKKIILMNILWVCSILCCNKLIAGSISTQDRSVSFQEVYGPKNAEQTLIIGNGGAGPTCVLEALSLDFINESKEDLKIAWIQTISRHTLNNLKDKIIDISLTYEAGPELMAIQEGWATNRTLVFNDHFLIVGPKSNPAGVLETDSPEEAFRKIASSGSFFSRNDASGTNERERLIWTTIGLRPWENSSSWYITKNIFPQDALKLADERGLYLLTDRGTLLATHSQLKDTQVYVQQGEILLNRCHAMLQKNPSKEAKAFFSYLSSERAQTLIANYSGKNKKVSKNCCSLFTPADLDEFLDQYCLKKCGL